MKIFKMIKVLVAIVLIAGLGMGAYLETSVGAASKINTDNAQYAQEMEDWLQVEAIPEEILECIPVAEGMETEILPYPGKRFAFHTGVITNIGYDCDGNIIRITILNRFCRQMTFNVIPNTAFYYQEGVPQGVELGSLVTVVTRPWPVVYPKRIPLEESPAQTNNHNFFEAWPSNYSDDELELSTSMAPIDPTLIPLPRWQVALAVVVHAPRPEIVAGTVADIYKEKQTMLIKTNGEEVLVRVNENTRYFFLPKLQRIQCVAQGGELDDVCDTECVIERPGFDNISIGDHVVIYAPMRDTNNVRLAKIVAVFPQPYMERISGKIIGTSDDTITLSVCSPTDVIENEAAVCQKVVINYTITTLFMLRGHLSVDVGEHAIAWCETSNTGDDLMAVRVIVQE